MNAGFIKLSRSPDVEELLIGNPPAFTLLALIAYRARRRGGFSAHNLEIGEAMLGDYESAGLTRQQYRTALRKLEEWGFVTIRTTSKGTIAKLTDSRIWDINPEETNQQSNHQTTTGQPSCNQRATTNEEGKKGRKEKAAGAGANTQRPSQEEIEEFVLSLGLPKTDGTACFNKWTGNGWKNAGAPIKDWKATIRSWQLHGYLPSQKSTGTGHMNGSQAPAKKLRSAIDVYNTNESPSLL